MRPPKKPLAPASVEKPKTPVSRRGFLTALGTVAAGTSMTRRTPSAAAEEVILVPARLRTARRLRVQAAENVVKRGIPKHRNNGEERDYPYLGNFSKGLPHNRLGEVNREAYAFLLKAVRSGRAADFENIPLGDGKKKLKNPQAAMAFELSGPDSHSLKMGPAPRLDTDHASAEIAELYWMSLLRDLPFDQYGGDSLIARAARELSSIPGYAGPKSTDAVVTPDIIFRGITAGDRPGPYISQFLFKDVPFGSLVYPQRQQTLVSGIDHLTTFDDWYLNIIGGNTGLSDLIDPTPRYIRNGRDLAQYVHIDRLFQASLNAALILLGGGNLGTSQSYKEQSGLPYSSSKNSSGFSTFGYPHLLTLVSEVTTRALKAVWFQKWLVHRRLRPEELGGRLHVKLTKNTGYPIHDTTLNSDAVGEVFSQFGTYLLPQAYHEACPLHPAYASGHATVMGAGITILKAWFDCDQPLRDPVIPDVDGASLVPYTGTDANSLTVGGELNKLAYNVSIGRNWGGIHWRSDASEGLRLGEELALAILREQATTFNEPCSMKFERFDGRQVVITGAGRG